jgi:acetyltransferase-like isoleucine patch superfamily enzyme
LDAKTGRDSKEMKQVKILINIIKLLLKLNLYKTIFFNLKFFPIAIAYKLPFHFYGRVVFDNLDGKIILKAKRISTGLVKFGGSHEHIYASREPTRIYISGTLEIDERCVFAKATNLMVWDSAYLKIGQGFSMGSFSKLITFREINIDNDVLVSWECQIFDTDFHFLVNVKDGSVNDNCGKIHIESGVWLGSRVTVQKSVYLPVNTVVATNSVCVKDYRGHKNENIVIAGSPAKVVKTGFEYLKDKRQEMYLYTYFRNSEDRETILTENC